MEGRHMEKSQQERKLHVKAGNRKLVNSLGSILIEMNDQPPHHQVYLFWVDDDALADVHLAIVIVRSY